MLRTNFPWWVFPWHWAKHWREVSREYQQVNRRLEGENRVLLDKNGNLLNQMSVNARKVTPGAHVLGYEQGGGVMPEFVLVGIDRGVAGGKRLYASRELGGPAFGLAGDGLNGSVYQLTTKMGNLLVIDKPSYGAAMDWMGQIWRNWDRERSGTPAPAGGSEPVQGEAGQPGEGQAEGQVAAPADKLQDRGDHEQDERGNSQHAGLTARRRGDETMDGRGNSFSNSPGKTKGIQAEIQFLHGEECCCSWCLQGHGKNA